MIKKRLVDKKMENLEKNTTSLDDTSWPGQGTFRYLNT
jgi:hypothetical protein